MEHASPTVGGVNLVILSKNDCEVIIVITMDYPTTQHKVIQSQLAHGKEKENSRTCLPRHTYVRVPLDTCLTLRPTTITKCDEKYLVLTKLRFVIGMLRYIRKYT